MSSGTTLLSLADMGLTRDESSSVQTMALRVYAKQSGESLEIQRIILG